MTTILYLLSEGLLIISIIAGVFFMLFILYIYVNLKRKETLNIIRGDDGVYFNLSDDELFWVKLSDKHSLSETITKVIQNEMGTLRDLVDSIDFINFKDDTLHRELNKLVGN
jgi:hypothetical protein